MAKMAHAFESRVTTQEYEGTKLGVLSSLVGQRRKEGSMSTVSRIMKKNPKTVGPGISVASAAKLMNQARVGSLLVKKGKQMVGIVTETDIVRRAVSTNKNLGKLTVDKIMTTPICTIDSKQSVDDAQDMMGDL